MELPFFQISTLEQVPYETEKAIVLEFFTQYLDKHVMVDVESRWSARAGFAASRFLHRAPSN
jgi:hypothetical protein